MPAGTTALTSAALGKAGGGSLEVDTMEGSGTQSLTRVYYFDVQLPPQTEPWFGARAYVKFDHGSEPLVHRWYRFARRLFLSEFDV